MPGKLFGKIKQILSSGALQTMSQTRWVETNASFIPSTKQDDLEGGRGSRETASDKISAAEVPPLLLPRPRPQLRPCDLPGGLRRPQ